MRREVRGIRDSDEGGKETKRREGKGKVGESERRGEVRRMREGRKEAKRREGKEGKSECVKGKRSKRL